MCNVEVVEEDSMCNGAPSVVPLVALCFLSAYMFLCVGHKNQTPVFLPFNHHLLCVSVYREDSAGAVIVLYASISIHMNALIACMQVHKFF